MAAQTSSSQRPSPRRLAVYRPILDRAIFALAVVGLLVSAHLTIQESRGFEEGCFGFASPQAATFDCGAVTQSEAATLFGIPNSIWGIVFYAAIAVLTAAAAFNWIGRRRTAKWLRATLIGVGFVYSAYLVYYQFFEISELCALCLVSAGVVAILAVAQAVDFGKSEPSSSSDETTRDVKSRREFAYMGALAAVVVLLIGADAMYFASAEAPEPYMPPAAPSAEQSVERASTADVNRQLPAECRYDLDRGPVEDYERLVNFYDATIGNPDADVTVIEYFDPNCPHCRTLHAIMEEVIETHEDQARFVFKPFFLWQHSIPQSEALYAAAQEGKFFEMLDHQYALQNPQEGLSPEELRGIAEDIEMDADALMQRIESGIYRRSLVADKEEAVAIGVNSTPTVLINGRFVATQSRSADCLRRMIEQAGES